MKGLKVNVILKNYIITLILNLTLISIPFLFFIIKLDISLLKIVFIIIYSIIILICIPYFLLIINLIIDIISKKEMEISCNNPQLFIPHHLISLSIKRKFTNELFSKDYTIILGFKIRNKGKTNNSKFYIKKSEFDKSELSKYIGIISSGNYERPIYLDNNICFKFIYYKHSKIIKSLEVFN